MKNSGSFFNMSGARAEKQRFQWYSLSFTANQWYRWKAYTPKVCLLGSQPTDVKNPKCGNFKPTKNLFHVPEICLIRRIEKFAEFRCVIICQIRAKCGRYIARKLVILGRMAVSN